MASWRDRILEQAEAARQRVSEVDLEQLRREDEAESSGFFAGFGLGILIGVVLALVFSPWKGEQTREVVTERAVQLKDRATGLVSHVRGDGNEVTGGGAAIEREIEDAVSDQQASDAADLGFAGNV